MKRLSVFLCVLFVLGCFCVSAGAATIKGKLVDQATSSSLVTSGYIDVYKLNGSGGWDWSTSASISAPTVNFTLSGLATGTYSLFFRADTYMSEYYSNATAPENRASVALTSASQIRNLGTISLRPLPLRITNAALSLNHIPATGGASNLTLDIVNDTSAAKKVEVHVIISAGRPMYTSTWVYGRYEAAVLTTTAPAASTVTKTIPIIIPPGAATGEYGVAVAPFAPDKWHAVSRETYVGSIFKEP
ncbi:MAG: hypothetical protein WAW37_06545 [Syntrophobacteraceae bacterium]